MIMLPGILMLLRFSIQLFPFMFSSLRKTRFMLVIIPRAMSKLGQREVLLLHDPSTEVSLPLSHPTKMCLSGMRIAESIGGQRMQPVLWP